MKRKVPFLPRLKLTRHLSTIVETRDEHLEEFSNIDSTAMIGKGEDMRRRFNRRVHSCSDIGYARNFNERKTETVTLPQLPNRTTLSKTQRHGKKPRDEISSSFSVDNTFPDFRPPDSNFNTIDFDAKIGKRWTRTNAIAKGDFSHNKENIVASWLQFFGWL